MRLQDYRGRAAAQTDAGYAPRSGSVWSGWTETAGGGTGATRSRPACPRGVSVGLGAVAAAAAAVARRLPGHAARRPASSCPVFGVAAAPGAVVAAAPAVGNGPAGIGDVGWGSSSPVEEPAPWETDIRPCCPLGRWSASGSAGRATAAGRTWSPETGHRGTRWSAAEEAAAAARRGPEGTGPGPGTATAADRRRPGAAGDGGGSLGSWACRVTGAAAVGRNRDSHIGQGSGPGEAGAAAEAWFGPWEARGRRCPTC